MGQFQAHRTTDPSTVAAEHEAILSAIEAGDPVAAADHLTEHLRAARDRLVTRIARDQPAQASPRVGA
jgi:DNA-binding GntR family transcriptional regulator